MTLEDWLACLGDPDTLSLELGIFPDRKLHLLTAALLRRVWDRLPSRHSQLAVEATEQFADGAISVDALAWVRSQAARESGETVWFGEESFNDYELINPCPCCSPCDAQAFRYECRVAKQGGVLDGVRRGTNDPALVAASAAFDTVRMENPDTAWTDVVVRQWNWQSLFATVREVLGENEPDPNWSCWRTSDVLRWHAEYTKIARSTVCRSSPTRSRTRGATMKTCCGTAGARAVTRAGAGSWTWRWESREALHHAPLL